MIFYRPFASPARPSSSTLRILTAVSLMAYPAGAAVRAVGGERFPFGIGGLALFTVALLTALPVLESRFHRIARDKARGLDEMELHLRHKALSWSYHIFTTLVVLGIFYFAVASYAGWWMPRSFDAWAGLLWGAILYSLMLPIAFLAWTVRDPAPD